MRRSSTTILIPCPVCRGTSRNPEAPAVIADDDGTCLVCCHPLHPAYAAEPGRVHGPAARASDSPSA